MTRTKIVCTIGPASSKQTTIQQMLRAGMTAARLNFSHGDHASHERLIRTIRAAEKKARMFLPIIADLQGPKIRVGVLPADVRFRAGETIEFPVTVRGLTRAVKKGHLVLIEDGLYEGKAVSTREGFLKVKMGNAGILRSHKGLNFPNSTFVMPAITAKDKEDAAFAVQ